MLTRDWVRRLGVCLFAVALSVGTLAAQAEPAPDDGKFKVVTTFTVLQDIAQNVAGDKATVLSITKPGAEIHDYQPTPLDIVKAQDADLVLWNGFNLERWFEKFLQNVEDVPSVVLTDGIAPMGIKEGPYSGKPNPHAWMSPSNALIYVENIRKALVKHDPANAETYNRNAEAYAAKIKALDEPLRKRLAAIPEGQRWLVTSEGAFSYLARDYDLREAYLWPINADEQGTPQQVRKVIDLVRENEHPGGVQREHDLRPRRQAGRQGNRRALWRRALRGFAEHRGRPGADLSRSPQSDGRDHRQGLRAWTHLIASASL